MCAARTRDISRHRNPPSSPSVAATNPAAIAGTPRSFSIETRRRSLEGRYISDAALNRIGVDSSTSGIRNASLIVPMAGANVVLLLR